MCQAGSLGVRAEATKGVLDTDDVLVVLEAALAPD
jgi:hypothetical protein